MRVEGEQVGTLAQEVIAAVESLYADRLRPYGRILRKRLAERAPGRAGEVDPRRLREVCEACPALYTHEEQGGEWSALLAGRALTFVDAYSPQDIYPVDLWTEAAAYFAGCEGQEMVLPGGRYSCAQVLMARRLPFLQGRSLGEVSHIVQLAISQKKLLGYLNGDVVPYRRSQSMVKDQAAKKQKPCTGAPGSGRIYATWDMVRTFVQDAIANLDATAGSLPLSNIKRLFYSCFHVELSETALGYAKLSELLQDPRLQDLCTVRLQGNSYSVFPVTTTAPQKRSISIADSLSNPSACLATPLSHVAAFTQPAGYLAMGPAPLPVMPQQTIVAPAMGMGVPNDHYAPAPWVTAQAVPCLSAMAPAGVAQVAVTHREVGCGGMPRLAPSPLELDVVEQGTEATTIIPQTPSPTSVKYHGNLPTLLGSIGPATHHPTAGLFTGPCSWKVLPPPKEAPVSSPVAPLGSPVGQHAPPFWEASMGMPPLLTPSTRSMLSVQNTFLHLKGPMPSLSTLGSSRRSRSQ
jgi:hypothetical protein